MCVIATAACQFGCRPRRVTLSGLASGDVRPSIREHTPGRTGYCREQSFKKVHLIRGSVFGCSSVNPNSATL